MLFTIGTIDIAYAIIRSGIELLDAGELNKWGHALSTAFHISRQRKSIL